MLKSETVFVLGAGASSEVGLPVGSELASIIREKMEVRSEGSGYLRARDRDLSNLFLLGAGSVSESEVHEYRKAAQRIREGIVLAERKSKMFQIYVSIPKYSFYMVR